MNVDDAAAEVYGVPLAEFVATRNALAKQADERSTAARIRGLRKPTVAAWLANQLARRYRDELEELVRTGEDMRAATTQRDGQRLRQLSVRGRELVDALVRRASEIADDDGLRPSADVAEALGDTLRAAMAEPAAADAVLAGLLTRPLEHVGFAMPGAAGAPADVISLEKARTARRTESGTRTRSGAGGRDVTARRPAADDRADAEQAETEAAARVEHQLAETGAGAEHQPTDAGASVEEVDAELELAQAEAAVEDADAVVEQLTGQRRTAKQRLAEARRARSRARDRVESTQRTFGRAEREVERLRQELDEAERTLDDARAGVDGATDQLGRADQEMLDADEALENTESELDRAHEESAAAREGRRKARQRLDRPLS